MVTPLFICRHPFIFLQPFFTCSPSSTMSQDVEKSLEELPKALFWNIMEIRQWENGWFEPGLIKPAMTFRSTFQARNDDILLASPIKTGTTWLKSLVLSITTNNKNEDVLATENPHFHVPTIESIIYSTKPPQMDLYDKSTPHLLHTHLPYAVLPDSVKNSETKIVYIARNPKDTLISMWHFFNSIFSPYQEPFPLQKAVDCFCSGVHQYGQFFDNVLGYWTESQKRPDKILFLKYEELKSDPKAQVGKIAEFLGKEVFGEEIDEILWRCSLERLKEMEVNKEGSIVMNVPNRTYFRKGVVGDSKNYLTPEMEHQIDLTSQVKLKAFGLFL